MSHESGEIQNLPENTTDENAPASGGTNPGIQNTQTIPGATTAPAGQPAPVAEAPAPTEAPPAPAPTEGIPAAAPPLLGGEGNPVPESVASLISEPSPPTTLAELNTTHNELLAGIENHDRLSLEIKAALKKLLQDEMQIRRTSGVHALADNHPQLLPGGRKSLHDYQENTKAAFRAAMRNTETNAAVDQEVQAELLRSLENIHTTSTALLKKSLEEEITRRKNNAFDNFKSYFKPENDVLSAVGGDAPNADFASYIENKSNQSITGSSGKSVHVSGNYFTSDDPKALGLAMVAAGHKKNYSHWKSQRCARSRQSCIKRRS